MTGFFAPIESVLKAEESDKSSLPLLIPFLSISSHIGLMCGNSGLVKNKTKRQGKNLPPIADSCVSSERINYVDNSHISTNLDCYSAPMR